MNVDAVAAQIKKRNYPAAIKKFCGDMLDENERFGKMPNPFTVC